jgi:hypothetical protein
MKLTEEHLVFGRSHLQKLGQCFLFSVLPKGFTFSGSAANINKVDVFRSAPENTGILLV